MLVISAICFYVVAVCLSLVSLIKNSSGALIFAIVFYIIAYIIAKGLS